jgi:hypothetical protein
MTHADLARLILMHENASAEGSKKIRGHDGPGQFFPRMPKTLLDV